MLARSNLGWPASGERHGFTLPQPLTTVTLRRASNSPAAPASSKARERGSARPRIQTCGALDFDFMGRVKSRRGGRRDNSPPLPRSPVNPGFVPTCLDVLKTKIALNGGTMEEPTLWSGDALRPTFPRGQAGVSLAAKSCSRRSRSAVCVLRGVFFGRFVIPDR